MNKYLIFAKRMNGPSQTDAEVEGLRKQLQQQDEYIQVYCFFITISSIILNINTTLSNYQTRLVFPSSIPVSPLFTAL